jgi:hypothetical protein
MKIGTGEDSNGWNLYLKKYDIVLASLGLITSPGQTEHFTENFIKQKL